MDKEIWVICIDDTNRGPSTGNVEFLTLGKKYRIFNSFFDPTDRVCILDDFNEERDLFARRFKLVKRKSIRHPLP